MADNIPWAENYHIANDLKQADTRVGKYARRAIDLSPYLQTRFRSIRNTIKHRTNGSVIESIPVDPAGEAGSNADFIQFCFDDQTEVLTQNGWLGWDKLKAGEAVATLSPDRKFEWQTAEDVYCNDYDGEMWEFENTRMSMKITPNHKVYGKFTGKPGAPLGGRREDYDSVEWKLISIEEALSYRHFWVGMRCDGWNGGQYEKNYVTIESTGYQPKLKIPHKLWARFMGWYLSEGCTKSKRGRPEAVMIGQSEEKNPMHYDEIWEMFIEMGLKPSSWKNNDSIVVHNSNLARMLLPYGLSGDKYISSYLKGMSKEILEEFLLAYIKGDGWKVGEGYATGTKSIEMREDLLEVAQKCGFAVTHYEWTDYRWSEPKIQYTVRLYPRDSTRLVKADPEKWKKVQYSGKVFCPSTDNGIVFVRRNGICFWSGNSELWGAIEENKSRMWSELTLSPTKFGKSLKWVESYAGYEDESEILYNLYDLGVKQGELVFPDRLYHQNDAEPSTLELYKNENARMLCLWNTVPRNPWQVREYYKQEMATLLPNEFLRMHRNQWVSNTDTFIPIEWFDACETEIPELPKNHSVVISLDAAVSDDTFGMVMSARHPDREKFPDTTIIVKSKCWVPTKSKKVDFSEVEDELRKWIANYNVVEVAYDPYQLHDMCSRLYKEGLAFFRAFPQGGGKHSRLIADSALRDRIRDRRIQHNGAHTEVRQHLQNADAKIDNEDRKCRIVKRVQKLKVDLAVCLSMSDYEVKRLNI